MGFVLIASATVCSNMRSVFLDVPWFQWHYWVPRMGQEGTEWWRDVTAISQPPSSKMLLTLQRGLPASYWLMLRKKHWSGWPCPELHAVLGKRICKR